MFLLGLVLGIFIGAGGLLVVSLCAVSKRSGR